MATARTAARSRRGGAFLLEEGIPAEIFTVEDLSPDQQAIARTAASFFSGEVAPHLASLQLQEPGLGARLLRKSASLGLTAVPIPEQYGGLELDLASTLVVEEQLGRDASYLGWHSAHAGIGTLPVLYFGTPEQKSRYLPKLASAELIAAYALTEPQAGSDALACRTRADLSADGSHYLLNGQKMWITNGGAADLFTVFAKVGGEKFSAFLVERGFGGVTSGAEERKMGIKGSSTTAVYFDNVRVPAENLLGQVGRGHVIAFNILNEGRLKLAASGVASSKDVIEICVKYAQQRQAFGAPIASFGAIQHKLGEMAIRVYAAQSAVWRVVGLIQEQPASTLGALEEFAVECSMVKVYASEVFAYAVDEGVQIHGGYGFHQDYAVERLYRDARINRIFEGTSEINRLLVTGLLLKRATRGQLDLSAATERVVSDIEAGKVDATLSDQDGGDEEARLVANAKNIALFSLGLAQHKFKRNLEQQQESMMHIADIIMEAFAMESALLRTRKLRASGSPGIAAEMTAVFLRDAMARIELSARNVIGACAPAAASLANMAALRKLAEYQPIDAVAARRAIAKRLLARGRFVV